MQRLKAVKITCEIHESLLEELVWVLGQLGIRDVLVQSARSVQLLSRMGLRTLFGKSEGLSENPYTVVSCYIPSDYEIPIMQFIIRACGLDMPGRGSLYSSDVELVCPLIMADNLKAIPKPRAMLNPVHLLEGLMGISCIVQRNNGNSIAQAALGLGTCVPVITFGEGTGLRDKLGLLRITIPGAKELVNLVVPDHDAEGIVGILVEEAKLNQAGKGFISVYPIRRALLNTHLQIGHQAHAASIEQIISAIDHLGGTTQWRRRFDQNHNGSRLPFFRNMHGVQVINDEGTATELAGAAMLAGASGATTTRLKYRSLQEEYALSGDPAKDLTTMVLAESLVNGVVDALLNAGLRGGLTGGFIELVACPLAFTYSQRR